jgi:hypothetical protein
MNIWRCNTVLTIKNTYSTDTDSVKFALSQQYKELQRILGILSKLVNNNEEPYDNTTPTLKRNSVLYAPQSPNGQISDGTIRRNASDTSGKTYYFYADSNSPVLISWADGIDENGHPVDIQRSLTQPVYTAWDSLDNSPSLYLSIDYDPNSDSVSFGSSTALPIFGYGHPTEQDRTFSPNDLYFDQNKQLMYQYVQSTWRIVYRVFVAHRVLTQSEPLLFTLNRFTLSSLSETEYDTNSIIDSLKNNEGVIDFGNNTVKATLFDGTAKYVPETDIGGNFWLAE